MSLGCVGYCVRTQPKKERLAATQLASLFDLETLSPRIRFKRKTVRGVVWFEEAMFLAIFLHDLIWQLISGRFRLSGCIAYSCFQSRFAAIDDAVIDGLVSRSWMTLVVRMDEPLAVGDETRILTGSMQGLPVQVRGERDVYGATCGRINQILGQEVETIFPLSELEQQRKGAFNAGIRIAAHIL